MPGLLRVVAAGGSIGLWSKLAVDVSYIGQLSACPHDAGTRLKLDAVKFNEDGKSYKSSVNHVNISCCSGAYLKSDYQSLSDAQKKIISRHTSYDSSPAIVQLSAPFAVPRANNSTHIGGH